MNIKRFALGGFRHVKDDEILVRGITVLQAMDNNSWFPNPVPALEDVQAQFDDFQAKLAMARRKGSPQDTAAKNASGSLFRSALQQLAFYVSKTADGDLQKLLSSGFALSGYPQSGVAPDVVRGLLLRDGKQSGQLRLDFEPQKGVLIYEYRYAQVTDEQEPLPWSEPFRTTSSRNNILAPVIPYQRCYVQVRALNGFGITEWSESVSHVGR